MYDELIKRLREAAISADSGNEISESLYSDILQVAEGGNMQKWKYVTKQEFDDFIKGYPFPLECDYFMDWYSWNDFRDGRAWPESMVAMASDFDEEYKIYDGYIKEET